MVRLHAADLSSVSEVEVKRIIDADSPLEDSRLEEENAQQKQKPLRISALSLLTLGYITPLVAMATKKTLNLEDLPSLPEHEQESVLVQKFNRCLSEARSVLDDPTTSPSIARKKRWWFGIALVKFVRMDLIMLVVLNLANVVVNTVQPVIVRLLVSYLHEKDTESRFVACQPSPYPSPRFHHDIHAWA
jgi:hypothetical protein